MINKRSTIKLSNGVEMPIIGLGVFQINQDDNFIDQIVTYALEVGYRLFDTAKAYGNEMGLGRALKNSGYKREDYFVTSKLFRTDVRQHRTREAFFETLKTLRMDYLDLYLIHWPVRGFENAWFEMEKLYREGYIRAIGISNCWPYHMDVLREKGTIIPMVNQVEFHPFKQQAETYDYCRINRIQLEAYGPFMQGRLLKALEFSELSIKYNKPVAQIVLRWIIQKGVIVIPKSATKARIMENIKALEFELSIRDMEYLDSLNRNKGSLPDPYTFW
jgi:diketogulonate reductase-like aldo/keto reductase